MNYLFDKDNTDSLLTQFFDRIYKASIPGEIFIFDVAEPEQVTLGTTIQGFKEGMDWIVLVEKEEDQQLILTRRIITFRKVGEQYRRDDELHRQRLYKVAEIAEQLRQAGFQIEVMQSYGNYKLPKAHTAFIARNLQECTKPQSCSSSKKLVSFCTNSVAGAIAPVNRYKAVEGTRSWKNARG